MTWRHLHGTTGMPINLEFLGSETDASTHTVAIVDESALVSGIVLQDISGTLNTYSNLQHNRRGNPDRPLG